MYIRYIYLIHGNYTATPGFHEFFCKTTIIRHFLYWIMIVVLQKTP